MGPKWIWDCKYNFFLKKRFSEVLVHRIFNWIGVLMGLKGYQSIGAAGPMYWKVACDRDRSDRKRSAAGLCLWGWIFLCGQAQTELGELTDSPSVAQIVVLVLWF